MKKSHLLFLSCSLILFAGCNNTQLTPTKKQETQAPISNEIEKKETEYERTVSYQEIIEKMNSANIKNKANKRVKNIVKEYSYNTSDDDSKNTAREKALTQVKTLILEEIGVFVESYLEIDKTVSDKKYHSYFKQEIKNLTAGIVKTKIIDEKFNGRTYYVKASVLVDPDSVSEGITEILKIKANKAEVQKLSSLLKSKEKDIDMRSQEVMQLQRDITSQALLSQAKEKELNQTMIKLEIANRKLSKYQAEERRIRTRLDEIKNIINQKTNNAIAYIERGMTYSEMVEMAGSPRSSGSAYPGEKMYNYGGVWVQFTDGVVGCITRFSGRKTSCKYYGLNSAYPSSSMVVK